jgi:hypothetical protein
MLGHFHLKSDRGGLLSRAANLAKHPFQMWAVTMTDEHRSASKKAPKAS